MVKVARKIPLKEEGNDVAYWRSRPPVERLRALDSLRWFQVVTLINPLTYVSEGMRGALVPGVPHIRGPICVGALLLSLAIFSAIGIRGFLRQAVDNGRRQLTQGIGPRRAAFGLVHLEPLPFFSWCPPNCLRIAEESL
jgi:hypothetical protein